VADGYVELTVEKLQTPGGVAELNRMILTLFNAIAGDGVNQKVYSGYGSPLNVVVADIGSLYLRLDGGASTSLYVKEADAGAATGWTAK